ncbi:hypothetical protein [Ralstonia sp.]|uniref:hypothetical protein n=1 Tax=Ralstonia sp. TaxID=54061 RepID=UPI0025798DFD|nr:hypothetical protein [Ralstonia sp.]
MTGYESQYRVWPDGTVQAVEDGESYPWMSDDFAVVWASDEIDAEAKALGKVAIV